MGRPFFTVVGYYEDTGETFCSAYETETREEAVIAADDEMSSGGIVVAVFRTAIPVDGFVCDANDAHKILYGRKGE